MEQRQGHNRLMIEDKINEYNGHLQRTRTHEVNDCVQICKDMRTGIHEDSECKN